MWASRRDSVVPSAVRPFAFSLSAFRLQSCTPSKINPPSNGIAINAWAGVNCRLNTDSCGARGLTQHRVWVPASAAIALRRAGLMLA